jgi:REP element-mobilizing transposase RayT
MGRVKQTEMQFRTWGGKRRGAGRPPKNGKAGLPHLRRSSLARRFPVHVTVRVRSDVYNLRAKRCFRRLEEAFWKGRERFGFRLIHYSVQGNHIHFLVEAENKVSLTRGMTGLTVRMARALNRVMQRKGPVFADRYHARILRTPTEVRNVREYLLNNAAHHYGHNTVDEYASLTSLATPQTWLLKRLQL